MLKKKCALIIVDIQNDGFLGGDLSVEGADKIIFPINKMRSDVKWDAVVLTQGISYIIITCLDFHPPDHLSFAKNHNKEPLSVVNIKGVNQILWPVHCVQGSKGVEFYKKLKIDGTEIIIQKGTNKFYDSYSAFIDNAGFEKTKLEEILKKNNITNVFVAGICYEWCVQYTACDSARLGFTTFFVEDCSLGMDKKQVGEAKKKMEKLGVKIVYSKDVKDLCV